MIAADQLARVLSAAGRFMRFVGGNKLAWLWRGLPLGLRAAGTLATEGFARMITVTGGQAPDDAGLGY